MLLSSNVTLARACSHCHVPRPCASSLLHWVPIQQHRLISYALLISHESGECCGIDGVNAIVGKQVVSEVHLQNYQARVGSRRPCHVSTSVLTVFLVLFTLVMPIHGQPFLLLDGLCAEDGDSCVTSPHYPESYGIDEQCSINITAAGFVTAAPFATEEDYDMLEIDGHTYSGAVGPTGVPVARGTLISWVSDYSSTGAGWRLCWSGGSFAPTTAAPMSATHALECDALAALYPISRPGEVKPIETTHQNG